MMNHPKFLGPYYLPLNLSKDAILSFYCSKTYFDGIIARMISFDASIS